MTLARSDVAPEFETVKHFVASVVVFADNAKQVIERDGFLNERIQQLFWRDLFVRGFDAMRAIELIENLADKGVRRAPHDGGRNSDAPGCMR